MKFFVLSTPVARIRAIQAVESATDGWQVVIKEPNRNLDQNAKMWAMLSDVSKKILWHGQVLDENDWKLIFMNALNSEMRIVPNLDNNGFVNLGRSSSKLNKAEMANLITLIDAFGAQNGVKFDDDFKENAA